MAARVPAEAIGAGAGMASEYANTDLMGAYAGLGEDLSLGLEGLRIGDLVALADADHRLRPRLPAGLPDHRGDLHRPVHAVRSRAGTVHAAERPGQAFTWSTTRTPTWPAGSRRHGSPGPVSDTGVTGRGSGGHRQPARRRRAPSPGRPPYRIDGDGPPTSRSATAGSCSASELGDAVFALADHAAPGACLVHQDPAARHALAAYACIGNQVGADRRRGRARRGRRQAGRGRPGHRRFRAGRPGPDAARRPGGACGPRPGLAQPGCRPAST